MKNALVSNISLIRERPYSFSIQTSPPGDVTAVYLSFDTEQQAKDWRKAIIAIIGNVVETEDSMMGNRSTRNQGNELDSEKKLDDLQSLQSFFDPADMFKKKYGDLCDLKPAKP